MLDIKTRNHGTDQIDLTHLGHAVEARPTEIHMKEDGAEGGKPSFAIVMEVTGLKVFGQVSLGMLSEAMNELGYDLKKKGE